MTLRFSYERDDIARAIRANFFSQAGIRFNTTLALCLIALGLWLSVGGAAGGLALASFIAGAGFIALLLIMWIFSPDIALWREPKYREFYNLTYSDSGVTFRKGGVATNLPWSIYSHVVAEASCYRLHHGTESWIVLPARAFFSLQDRARFEALLAAHVPRVERR